MSHDCNAFVPSYGTVSIYHLKDLAAGTKRRLSNEGLRNINVPYFDKLTLETMLDYAEKNEEVMAYLPAVKRERTRLSIEYVG